MTLSDKIISIYSDLTSFDFSPRGTITLQNDGENAVLKYDYWKALPDEA